MESKGVTQTRAEGKVDWKARLCMAAIIMLLGLVMAPSLDAQAHISLDVRDADVREVLLTLAERGGLNMVIAPDVRGGVTLRLQDVSVEEALEALLRTTGLAQVREGAVIGILSHETLLKQHRLQAERHTLGMAPLRTAVVPLHYSKAAELAPVLAALLSPWGSIAVDERTNSLIIRDLPRNPVFQKHHFEH
jgi:type IV pilus assembly protein PilQ